MRLNERSEFITVREEAAVLSRESLAAEIRSSSIRLRALRAEERRRTETQQIEKSCRRCKETKPVSEFNTNNACRSGFGPYCKVCTRAASKKHYENNKVEHQAKAKAWRHNNPGRAKEVEKASRDRTKERRREKVNIAAMRYYRANAETIKPKMRIRSKKWYAENKTRLKEKYKKGAGAYREKSKKWREDNPDKFIATIMRVKLRHKEIEGSFTAKEWRDLKKQYKNRCVACGAYGRLSVDHVIPTSKGGTGYITNIQPLCLDCNRRKSDKSVDYRKSNK